MCSDLCSWPVLDLFLTCSLPSLRVSHEKYLDDTKIWPLPSTQKFTVTPTDFPLDLPDFCFKWCTCDAIFACFIRQATPLHCNATVYDYKVSFYSFNVLPFKMSYFLFITGDERAASVRTLCCSAPKGVQIQCCFKQSKLTCGSQLFIWMDPFRAKDGKITAKWAL